MYRILILILIFASSVPGQTGTWEIVDEMQYPVAGGTIFSLNQNIYVAGGYSEQIQDPVKWIQKYDLFSGLWTIEGQLVKERYGFCGGYFQGHFLMTGGGHDTTAACENIESWSPGAGYTMQIASNTAMNRIFCSGLVHNETFYIVGGNPWFGSLPDNSYIMEYNISDDEFVYINDNFYSGSNYPEQQMTAALGDYLYIFGGVYYGVSSSIYRYDIAEKTLVKLPVNLMVPRAGGCAVSYSDDTILIIGGFNGSNEALNSVEFFKVNNEEYSLSAGNPLNIARKHAMAVEFEGAVYVMGGFDEEENVVSEIELLSVPTTFIQDAESLEPRSFDLSQNYPNPFNPSTKITYTLNSPGYISLKVYDILGNEVETLTKGFRSAGTYETIWNTGEKEIAGGIYLYSLKTGIGKVTRKMVLLR